MSLRSVCRLLRHRGRSDLASLLERASVVFEQSDSYGSFYESRLTTAEVTAPIRDYDRLGELGGDDQKVILRAMLEIWPPGEREMEISGIVYRLDPDSLEGEADVESDLVGEVERLRDTMIAVATGGPRIDSVNLEYQERYRRVDTALRELGVGNPIPYRDLWAWYGKWSSGELASYQSRREYIRGLFAPLEERLREEVAGRGTNRSVEPTGWPRVDRALGGLRKPLEEASTEEQFQAVGLLCREVLISLAQAVYDAERHPATDGTTPSETDAKRMLDAYLAAELAGGDNAAARRHAKASLDLANALQHQRTATFRQAALCSEATASVVNIIAIISGRRDPEPGTS